MSAHCCHDPGESPDNSMVAVCVLDIRQQQLIMDGYCVAGVLCPYPGATWVPTGHTVKGSAHRSGHVPCCVLHAQVVKQCVGTEGVEGEFIKTEILPEFFAAFWNRRMALDK